MHFKDTQDIIITVVPDERFERGEGRAMVVTVWWVLVVPALCCLAWAMVYSSSSQMALKKIKSVKCV